MDTIGRHTGDRRRRRAGGMILAVTALLALALAGCSCELTARSGGNHRERHGVLRCPLTGTPYVFGTDSTDSSQSLSLAGAADGFVAWANYTNAHGGILGHPVKIVRCNDQGTPDGSSACARQLIQNSSVLAVAGSESPVIASAGEPLAGSGRPPLRVRQSAVATGVPGKQRILHHRRPGG